MNYTLHQLKVFLKVSEHSSITKAAEELHLSQPAVSIQLKNFQDQFSESLTEVVGRQLYVTDFGKEIIIASQKIINEVEVFNQKLSSYGVQNTGKLRISMVPTGQYIMPHFLTGFSQENPELALKMEVNSKDEIIKRLEKNEIDFAFVSVAPQRLSLAHLTFMPNKLFLVGNYESELDATGTYPSKILEEIDLIFRAPESATQQIVKRHIHEQKLAISKQIEFTSNDAIKQAVVAGLGYAIMPLVSIKNELALNQVKIIPIENFPLTSDWQLVWLKEKKLSRTAKAFLDSVRVHKDEIIKAKFSWYETYSTK